MIEFFVSLLGESFAVFAFVSLFIVSSLGLVVIYKLITQQGRKNESS